MAWMAVRIVAAYPEARESGQVIVEPLKEIEAKYSSKTKGWKGISFPSTLHSIHQTTTVKTIY
jgi:hypothetical protein